MRTSADIYKHMKLVLFLEGRCGATAQPEHRDIFPSFAAREPRKLGPKPICLPARFSRIPPQSSTRAGCKFGSPSNPPSIKIIAVEVE
jgi:hypothetical protein